MKMNKEKLIAAIKEYLMNGGLFNPDLMDHREVSLLLLQALDYLSKD